MAKYLIFILLPLSCLFGQYIVTKERTLTSINSYAFHPNIKKLSGSKYAVIANNICFILDSATLSIVDSVTTRYRKFEVLDGKSYIVMNSLNNSTTIKHISDAGLLVDSINLPYEYISCMMTNKSHIYIGSGIVNSDHFKKFPMRLLKLNLNLDTLWTLNYSNIGFEDLQIDFNGDLVALTQSGDLLKIDTSLGIIKTQRSYPARLGNYYVQPKFIENKVKTFDNGYLVCDRKTPGASRIYKLNSEFEFLDSLIFNSTSTDYIVENQSLYVLSSDANVNSSLSNWHIHVYDSNFSLKENINFIVDNTSKLYAYSGALYKEGQDNFLVTSSYGASSQFKFMRIGNENLLKSMDVSFEKTLLYPNPAYDILKVNTITSHVILHDSKGSYIATKQVSPEGFINISDLNIGFYFAEIDHNMIKFIKD